VANPNGAKGTDWETALVNAFNESGVFPLEVFRLGKQGRNDKGDFANTGPFCIEAKNEKRIDLATAIKEAKVEAENAGKRFPIVATKARRKSVQDGYITMEVRTFLALLKEVMPHLGD